MTERPESPARRTSSAMFLVVAVAGIVLGCMLAQILAYAWLSAPGEGAGSFGELIRRATGFRNHAIEWLLLLAFILWCLARRRRFWVWLSGAVLLLFTTVQVTQVLAFYFTQQMLTRDALQNAQHIGLLVSPFTVAVALLPVAVTAVVVLLVSRSRRHTLDIRTRFISITAPVTLAVLLALSTIGTSNPGLPPVAAMADLFLSSPEPLWVELGDDELATIREYGFTIDPGARYPFIKDRIFRAPIPFSRHAATARRPNVIIFFVESLSARKLSIYGSPYPDITPNIEVFARHSMVVDNYFNHTAATYRAFQGQLCSMYPFYGGAGGWLDPRFEPPDTRLLGLPHLAGEAGYDTIFLGANTIELAHMNVQAESMGFAGSMLRRQIDHEFLGDEPVYGPHLSDHQMMRALQKLLQSRRLTEPFFLFMYNVGTHTNLDSKSDSGVYADGASNVLNTTHAFDDAFGRFWRFFESSPLAENTVVVLTADHAHFPTPAFVKVAGPGYKKVFFDRIAFVIYDPYLELPPRYDARVRTSLDFAPTMAHLLDLPNQRNPFLGRSIFDQKPGGGRSKGLGWYSNTLCLITKTGRARVYSTSSDLPPEAATMARFIELSQYAELNDRLWDGEPGG